MAEKKPEKPYADFPLFPDSNGQWVKKVRGKKYTFGVWADPQAALDRWNREKDDLLAGRGRKVTSHSGDNGATISELLNLFRAHKKAKRDFGEISDRTFQEYHDTCTLVARNIDKNRIISSLLPFDFAAMRTEMAKRWGPVRLGNEIQRVRSIFKYAFEIKLIPSPMAFGVDFAKPSKKTLRINRAKRGSKLYEPSEILAMLVFSGTCLSAMILLGVNCGLGNTDCAKLKLSAIDFKRGWLTYPRQKTGVERRAKLWPETLGALVVAYHHRQTPKNPDDNELVFITKHGTPWVSKCTGGDCPISKEMAKTQLAANCRRTGCGFYGLRHTFETIAGESGDQVAVDYIMWHAPDNRDMSSVYRERMADARLEAVASHVHRWLFDSVAQ